MKTTKEIFDYNVTCEFDHEQYWQGHGICHTPYDDCATGNGSSPSEALEDCLESLAQGDIRFSDEQIADITSSVQGVYGKDFETSTEDEDCYFYVSIDVQYDKPEEDLAEDSNEDSNPDEDSITTTNHETFYQYGKVCFTIAEHDDENPIVFSLGFPGKSVAPRAYPSIDAAIKAALDVLQFWPDVFFVSDHGNAHLIEYWKER